MYSPYHQVVEIFLLWREYPHVDIQATALTALVPYLELLHYQIEHAGTLYNNSNDIQINLSSYHIVTTYQHHHTTYFRPG